MTVQIADALDDDEPQTKQLKPEARMVEHAVNHPPHRFIQLVEHVVETLEIGGKAEKGLGQFGNLPVAVHLTQVLF